jgi:hypothetical protein
MFSELGKSGWELQQTARGVDPRPFVPLQRLAVFLEKIDFEWPISDWEPFWLHVRPRLERLSAQLACKGQACRALEMTFQLDPRGEEKRSIRLRAPTHEPHTLLRLLQGQIFSHPPRAPLLGLTLLAHPDAPRQAQLSLFGPPVLSPTRVATTLAQLFTLLGAERVGTPVVQDGYRPERFVLGDFNPPPAPLLPEASLPTRSPALSAMRVLRPPVPVEVKLSHAWPWEPLRVQPLQKHPSIAGTVHAASGPWRMEEAWWTEEGIQREYWDVELSDGGLYRLYADRQSGTWFVDGVYD